MSIEKSIPTQEQNPKGLHQRFYVEKLNGETDPKAEYFVLRLDNNGKDPNHINACRIGIQAYATAIEPFIPELAKDLKERYPAQQPVRKTLDEVKDEVAEKLYPWPDKIGKDIYHECEKVYFQQEAFKAGVDYAQTKAVEPQQGWVDVKKENLSKLTDTNNYAVIFKHTGAKEVKTGFAIKVQPFFYSHYMPLPEPPTQANN